MGEPVAYTICETDTPTFLESITDYGTKIYSWLGRNITQTNHSESIVAGTTVAFVGTFVFDLYLLRAVASSSNIALLGAGTFTVVSLLTVAGGGAYCYSKATNTEDIEATISLIDVYDETTSSYDNQTDSDNSTDDYDFSTNSPEI